MDRCELCGANAPATFVGRTRHLRKEHPAYARGLLLRILAPVVFLAGVVGLQALDAPVWTVLVVAAGSAGLAIAGLWIARVAKAGSDSKPTFMELFREGGYRFVLIAGVFAVMLILASRQ
ncbi:MAG: hypothetical protein ACRDKS_06100 [Actinomycetota bacterium]